MRTETAFDKASDKQKLSFRKSFLKDIESFCVDMTGRGDIKQLHANRSELRKMARQLIDTADKEKRKMKSYVFVKESALFYA